MPIALLRRVMCIRGILAKWAEKYPASHRHFAHITIYTPRGKIVLRKYARLSAGDLNI